MDAAAVPLLGAFGLSAFFPDMFFGVSKLAKVPLSMRTLKYSVTADRALAESAAGLSRALTELDNNNNQNAFQALDEAFEAENDVRRVGGSPRQQGRIADALDRHTEDILDQMQSEGVFDNVPSARRKDVRGTESAPSEHERSFSTGIFATLTISSRRSPDQCSPTRLSGRESGIQSGGGKNCGFPCSSAKTGCKIAPPFCVLPCYVYYF